MEGGSVKSDIVNEVSLHNVPSVRSYCRQLGTIQDAVYVDHLHVGTLQWAHKFFL